MRRVVGVLSGKGGVGKTTTSINLSLAMHNLGEDVVVVDTDLKNPTLGIQLGVFNYDNTLHDVLQKGMPLLEAVYVHKTGLRFVPSHVSLGYLNIDPSRLGRAFSELYFTTVLDAPPGLGKEAMSVMEVCDELLIVTTPALPDVAGALRTIEVARSMGKRVAGIVLNKRRGKSYEVTARELEATSGVRVLAEIPWDDNVMRAVSGKEPVVAFNPYAPSSIRFYELASQLAGKPYSPPALAGLKNLVKTLGNIL